MLFGIRLTEAHEENGFVTPWFERARLEFTRRKARNIASSAAVSARRSPALEGMNCR